MPHIKGTALIPAVKLYRKNREKMDPFLDDVARKLDRRDRSCSHPLS
jgi:hypothetical protein